MLVVVLHYADGEVMEFGPFSTFTDAFHFARYMAQSCNPFDNRADVINLVEVKALVGVKAVREDG